MKQIFLFVTKLFDTNLIGILIGIVSGIAVNIATGQKITDEFQAGIYWMSAAVVCLIFLSKLRSAYDDRFAKQQGESITPSQKWDIAVDVMSLGKTLLYIAILIGFFASIFFGISRIIEGHKKEAAEHAASPIRTNENEITLR